ncbi:MAG: rhodanese-like domain-containing protein [Oscillibacter sp.]|nr:rhodanese-like domain-containing protein [Oscillibacter sp.]MCI9003609.1 rhodanese-like domain-containing protein [Oscillibacter sp.]
MKQLFLLAAVICFGVAILKFYSARMGRSAPQAENKPWSTITGEEAKARLDANEDAILLDVRTQEEYDGGHITGAVCLPNEDIQPDLPLPFEKDAEILVYCRSGRRSAEAAKKLTDMGYTNVSDFGSIQNWPEAE